MRELIQSIEGNFREYFQLLNKIEHGGTEAVQKSYQLRELLHTLADIQDEVVDFRLKKIQEEEHPYIPQIRIERIKQNGQSREYSFHEVVDGFLRQRKELLKMLYALPIESWDRTGVHEVEGHVSFKEFVRRMAEKDKQILSKLNQVLMQSDSSRVYEK